jgi:hypothetical protein
VVIATAFSLTTQYMHSCEKQNKKITGLTGKIKDSGGAISSSLRKNGGEESL